MLSVATSFRHPTSLAAFASPCVSRNAQHASRPLRVHFERGELVVDDNVGQIMFKKTVGVPRSYSAWQRRYYVLGGAVAKSHVLQVYVSKQVRG